MIRNHNRPAQGRRPAGNRCVFCGAEGVGTVWTATAGRILVCEACRATRFPARKS